MGEIRNERVAVLVLQRLVVALFLMAAIAVLPTVTRAATQPEVATPEIAPMTPTERAAAIASAKQATVRVSSDGCDVRVVGSGFVADGLLITNSHIAGDAQEITVDRLDSSGVPTRSNVAISRRSAGLDLAVGDAHWGSTLTFNDSVPAIGEPVLLVGFGGGQRLSALDATVHSHVDGTAYGSQGHVLLLDRMTSVGFSGGPVVDRNGNVVAVLRAFDSMTGLTIAVPTANVVELADRAANDAQQSVCK